MRTSARFAALLALLGAGLLAPGGAATGAPPGPVSTTETFDAGEACAFPIEVVFTGKSGFVELPGNPEFSGIATSPGLRVTVTNLDTDEAVTLNATGAFRFVGDPATGDFTVVAGGNNFLYGVPEVGATALLTTGPIEVTVVDGDIAEMDLSGARVLDVCAELA